MTLSDKIFSNFWIATPKDTKLVRNVILASDVKEFIKLLKKEIDNLGYYSATKSMFKEKIDQLAGDELI